MVVIVRDRVKAIIDGGATLAQVKAARATRATPIMHAWIVAAALRGKSIATRSCGTEDLSQ
jgi:hypothetical protein